MSALDSFPATTVSEVEPSDASAVAWLADQHFRQVSIPGPSRFIDLSDALDDERRPTCTVKLPFDTLREFFRYLVGEAWASPYPPGVFGQLGDKPAAAKPRAVSMGEADVAAKRPVSQPRMSGPMNDASDDESVGGVTGAAGRLTRWSTEDDERLTELVRHHGTRRWQAVARDMKKTARSCRERYGALFPGSLEKDGWSMTDDFLLMSALEKMHGSWAKMVQLFPRRTAADIKGRAAVLKEKGATAPGSNAVAAWESLCNARDLLHESVDAKTTTAVQDLAAENMLRVDTLIRDEKAYLADGGVSLGAGNHDHDAFRSPPSKLARGASGAVSKAAPPRRGRPARGAAAAAVGQKRGARGGRGGSRRRGNVEDEDDEDEDEDDDADEGERGGRGAADDDDDDDVVDDDDVDAEGDEDDDASASARALIAAGALGRSAHLRGISPRLSGGAAGLLRMRPSGGGNLSPLTGSAARGRPLPLERAALDEVDTGFDHVRGPLSVGVGGSGLLSVPGRGLLGRRGFALETPTLDPEEVCRRNSGGQKTGLAATPPAGGSLFGTTPMAMGTASMLSARIPLSTRVGGGVLVDDGPTVVGLLSPGGGLGGLAASPQFGTGTAWGTGAADTPSHYLGR